MGGGAKTGSTLSGNQKVVDTEISKFLKGRIGQAAAPYQGQLVAGLMPQYDQILKGVNQFNGNYLMQDQTAAMRQALSGKAAAQLDPATTAKYYDQAVGKPLMQAYDKYVAPRINEAYGSQGAFLSSRRALAQQSALQDTTNQYMSGLAQAQLQNQQLNAQYQESAANRAFQAAPIAAQLRAQPLALLATQQGLLQPYQSNAQQQLDAQYNEYLRTRPESSPWLQLGLNYIGQNQMYQQQKGSPVAGALGGALGGAASGAAIGSVIPGIGTAIGALGGALVGGVGGGFTGR